MNHETDLQRIVIFFETLTTATAQQLEQIYAWDAWFKDPFNDVRGLPAITRVYSHMFKQVDVPRFVITSHVMQDDHAFLTWNFLFRMKRFSSGEQCIRGASHLRFDGDGRIASHRDYWDAAEELYEKLPMLGSLMRMLKRAAAA